jgi:DNA-binding NtrC family response regulator
VKFLRVLENGEFLRVGSSQPRTVNVRVIAATNKDLENEVRLQRFRADVFYRLRSVNIVIPPLRERVEDIALLFRHFAGEVARRNKIQFAGISDAAMHELEEYHWPGNVRELRNVVESMLVLESGKYLQPEDVRKYLKEYRVAGDDRQLPVPLGKSVEQAERELILRALLDIKGNLMELRTALLDHLQTQDGAAPAEDAGRADMADPVTLDDMEHRMIADALGRFKGNRRAAARALKISERTLYRKIKEYRLE